MKTFFFFFFFIDFVVLTFVDESIKETIEVSEINEELRTL